MKQVDKYMKFENFKCYDRADEGELKVGYDNRGDPYSEGVRFAFEDGDRRVSVYLDDDEVRRLVTVLNNLYPVKP